MRPIREEEVILLKHLLSLALVEYLFENIPSEVNTYNPQQKESINLSHNKEMDYNGDIIRVEFVDTDSIPVTITLTKNMNGQLLDLDFWKEDFLPLNEYPTPEKVKVVR